MAVSLADRVSDQTTTTGTGTFTLAGVAPTGYRTFASVTELVGTVVPYFAGLGADWEVGTGTFNGTTLTRTPTASSNAGSLVNFGAGTKTVFLDASASLLAGYAVIADGLAVTDLADAGALVGTDYIVVSQGGVEKKVTLTLLKAFTGGAIQAPVTSLAAGTATTTTIPLTWVNGSGGTSWTVTQRLTGSGSYTASTLSVAASATGATVSGLTASTAYDFQVTATGTNGTSAATTLTNTSTAAPAAATAVTMTGPTGGVVSVASTNFSIGVSPVGGTITGTVVVTPSDSAGGGTFTPTTVSLTNASPTATFTYTPSATAGARTISVTNNGSLTNPSNITYTSTAATVPYTIVGNSSNAVKTTSSASAATVYGSIKQMVVNGTGGDQFTSSPYWNINATTGGAQPASAVSGWGTSNSTAPATITQAANQNSGSSINGMTPMTKPGAFSSQANLWVTNGSGTSTWYFWIKPIDGDPYCVNPSGMSVTGA